jgi:hypothetical protein
MGYGSSQGRGQVVDPQRDRPHAAARKGWRRAVTIAGLERGGEPRPGVPLAEDVAGLVVDPGLQTRVRDHAEADGVAIEVSRVPRVPSNIRPSSIPFTVMASLGTPRTFPIGHLRDPVGLKAVPE